jgi:alpha-ketoglutarate-dependent taurine dioxygenase
MATFTPLSEGFGLQADGIDLSQPLSDAAFDELSSAFYRGGVLVVRGQRLSAAQFHGLARRIGGLFVRHHYGNRDDLDTRTRTVASVLTDPRDPRTLWRITVKSPGGLPA